MLWGILHAHFDKSNLKIYKEIVNMKTTFKTIVSLMIIVAYFWLINYFNFPTQTTIDLHQPAEINDLIVQIDNTEVTIQSQVNFEIRNLDTWEIIQSSQKDAQPGEVSGKFELTRTLNGKYEVSTLGDSTLPVTIFSDDEATITTTLPEFKSFLLTMFISIVGIVLLVVVIFRK